MRLTALLCAGAFALIAGPGGTAAAAEATTDTPPPHNMTVAQTTPPAQSKQDDDPDTEQQTQQKDQPAEPRRRQALPEDGRQGMMDDDEAEEGMDEDMQGQGMRGEGMRGRGRRGQAAMEDEDTAEPQNWGRRGRMEKGMGGQMMKFMFVIADQDGDGQLSFEEVSAIHKRIFDRIDVSKDGKVSRKEVLSFMRE